MKSSFFPSKSWLYKVFNIEEGYLLKSLGNKKIVTTPFLEAAAPYGDSKAMSRLSFLFLKYFQAVLDFPDQVIVFSLAVCSFGNNSK